MSTALDLAPTPRRRPAVASANRRLRLGHGAAQGRVWLGVAVALATALVLAPMGIHLELAVALGALVGALVWVADGWLVAARTLRVESQLADALDLLGSSVASGVGFVESMDGVVREIRGPVRAALATAAERLRLGDDPQRVFDEAERMLPLPAFRLLTHFLAAQWQSGGALAPGLHAIAEAVRDRVDLSRRVHAQSAEARFSVFGILLIVYGIAVLAWTTTPVRVEAFVSSEWGGGIVAFCVALQAVGVVWMARMTRIELR